MLGISDALIASVGILLNDPDQARSPEILRQLPAPPFVEQHQGAYNFKLLPARHIDCGFDGFH